MKRIYLICLLLSCHFAQAQDDLKSTFQRIYEDINTNSEAYERLKYSTEHLGHRLTGSEQGKKAEEHVYNLLKSYGYDVKYQPFSAQSWARESLSLTLNKTTVPSVSLAHSPVKVDLQADLVDLGNGLETDYEKIGSKIKGKIALVFLHILPNSGENLKNLHRSEKTALASKYGAKGIVFINSVKGNVLLTGTASITGKLIEIPAICIGFEDGMKWKEKLAKEKVVADIKMHNKSDEATARNVIVSIVGSEYPEEKIVIGGHLDSWDLATGAIDNGLGSYAIIDMARSFKKLGLKPKRSIDFVLFMGEEQGLLGSKAYVQEAIKSGTLGQVKYMLNFDMVNAPIGFSTSRDEMIPLLDSIGLLYSSIDSDFKNKNSSGAGLHSDHQPFMLQGIPSGSGTGGQLPNDAGLYYHSDNDVFKLVDKRGLEQTVRVGAAYLYGLSSVKDIPAQRFSDAEIVKFLDSKGLKEPLMISGEWRWGK
ncbi:M28 family peptidase [Sphingobacterium endophyticum]|uniref:M28 family peptidase n=1 Tax=Sphingobacterium endophyticum TaxID=2546448 RepID=UPI0012E2D79E|nr:M28 family peptidase [Sphingobacterium endophyticum]